MEFIIVLLFGLPLGVLIWLIVLQSGISGLRQRIFALEKELRALRAQGAKNSGEPLQSPPVRERQAEIRQVENKPEEKAREAARIAAEQRVAEQRAAEQKRKDKVFAAAEAAEASRKSGELIAETSDTPKPQQAASAQSSPPSQYVFNNKNKNRFSKWLSEYWLYLLGALTMALAGIYLVRYGIENGYITPIMRVLSAYALGAGLLYAAEWIRRRGGDEAGSVTEYLPSAIGASAFAIFYAAGFGAFSLYGLISASTAFFVLFFTALFAIVAGLRFGLLISALGVLGAYLAPLLVGENSGNAYLLHYYAVLVLASAMIVDSMRRSAWLSVFAMLASLIFAVMIYSTRLDIRFDLSFLAFGFAQFVLAVVIPERKLMPSYSGNMFFDWLKGQGKTGFPEFPVRLIALGFVSAVGIVVGVFLFGAVFWYCLAALFILAMLAFYWLGNSEALQDLPLIPIVALLGLLIIQVLENNTFGNVAPQDNRVTEILLIGLVLGLSAAQAGFVYKRLNKLWHLVAILLPLLFSAIIGLYWTSGSAHPNWVMLTLLMMAYSGVLFLVHVKKTGLASLYSELSALSIFAYLMLLAFGLLEGTALKLALLAILVALVELALRLSWKWHARAAHFVVVPLSLLVIVSLGHGIFSGRIDWPDFGIALLVLAVYYFLLKRASNQYRDLRFQFEGWGFVIFASLCIELLERGLSFLNIENDALPGYFNALLFLAFAIGAWYRRKIDDGLRPLRTVIASVNLAFFVYFEAFLLIFFNPLLGGLPLEGWPILNWGLLVYGSMAAMAFAFGALAKINGKSGLEKLLFGLSGALVLMNIYMQTRKFWIGDFVAYSMPYPMGEIVTYTAMMLIAIIALVWWHIRAPSQILRRLAFGLLVLTALKVYFIDLSETAGIARVAVLFVFGAVIFAFSFIDRKIQISQAAKGQRDFATND